MRRFRAPMVGGPRHGQVHDFDTDITQYKVAQPASMQRWTHYHLDGRQEEGYLEPQIEVVTYTRRTLIAVFPGRIDRQAFRVMVDLSDPDVEWLVQPTVFDAWRDGWSPAPENSEFWPHGPDATDAERAFYALYQMGAA